MKHKYYIIIVCLLFYHINSFSQTITLGTDWTCQFDTVTLPVTISSSANVGAITFTIDYNTNDLEFVDFLDIAPSLINNGLSTFNNVNNQARFVWFSNGLNAATLTDTIVKIRFVGLSNGNFPVSWDITSTNKSEIADLTGNTMSITFANGLANFQPSPTNTTFTSTDTAICTGQSITFTATGGTLYEFSVNGIIIQSQNSTNTFTSTSLTNGDEVSVEIFNGIGCSVAPLSIVIGVNDYPFSDLSGDTSICEGETTLLDFTLPATGFYNVIYKTGFSTIQVPSMINGAQIAVTPNVTTDYILLSVENVTTGCILNNINDTVQVEIFQSPLLDLGEDVNMCSDDVLLLDAGVGGTFQWSDGSNGQTLSVDNEGVYSVIKTDGNTCQSFDTVTVIIDCFILSGQFTYANSAGTPMSNTVIELVDLTGKIVNLPSGGNPVTTDNNGDYLFKKVPVGNYKVKPIITKPHGGTTIDDATLILKTFTNLSFFDQLSNKAADVSADNAINGLDGLLIAKRANGSTNYFPSGDWTYDDYVIFVTTADLIHLFRALCMGDVDKSHVP